MQNTEFFEIDLTQTKDSQALVDYVVNALETSDKKGASVKLKLDDAQISQSQMIFIKSLIESYGFSLGFVQTTNSYTRDICIEMGIGTSIKAPSAAEYNDIRNEKLDDLREQFKAKFNEGLLPDNNTKEDTQNDLLENKEEKPEIAEEKKEENNDNDTQDEKYAPDEKDEEIEQNDVQKQVISVYRKADEEENRLEFQDEEEVDFYAPPTNDPVVADSKQTIYVHQTLRSGQIIDFDGNVVIIGDCHPGSEIKATGDITVWGVLGSIAHAGAKGNAEARIRALKMNAVQLRIANCYSRRPDSGNIPYIVKSSVFTPEEARIVDDNIVLFKMAQN